MEKIFKNVICENLFFRRSKELFSLFHIEFDKRNIYHKAFWHLKTDFRRR